MHKAYFYEHRIANLPCLAGALSKHLKEFGYGA